jgi:hypothetical protein
MTFHDALPYLIAQIPTIAVVILGLILEGIAFARVHGTLDLD